MMSDEEKADFVRDGLDPVRREMFRKGQYDPRPPMSMEQYLEWLADMERWFPAPPPSHITRCDRMLL
jgi:hypothetical protein